MDNMSAEDIKRRRGAIRTALLLLAMVVALFMAVIIGRWK
jgi:hypothetical protein